MLFTMTTTSRTRRCGLPVALLAAGSVALLSAAFVTADAQETPPQIPAADAQKANIAPERRAEIEQVIKEYLMANPELLLQAQQALEAKMEKEQTDKTKAALKENANDIFKDPESAVGGNPDGDVTIVEFFDYNCGYCRRSYDDIASVIKKDPKIRFVFKELPIINQEASPGAAKVALAARKQGKYMEVHAALMKGQGIASEATALTKAEALGLDMKKLKADMESPEIKAELDKVMDLAKKLGVGGTPFFLVGDHVVAGGYDNLDELLAGHVADVRKSGCSYC
jgi:protein-disulfide isomerase